MVRLMPRFLEQNDIIGELLPEQDRPCRILDLGGGNGILSPVVFEKLPQAHIDAFDLTEIMQPYEKNWLAASENSS